MTTSLIHPDDLASEYAAHEPYSYYATADAEAHYLWQAGFVAHCDCFRCDAEAEAAGQAAWEQEEYEARIEAMTDDELDAYAQEEFDYSAKRQADEFAPDPWGVPGLPSVDDEIGF